MTSLIKYFKRSPSALVIFLLILSTFLVNFNIAKWNKKSVIDWDVTYYYSYLPATFIKHDITLKFVDENPGYYAQNHQFIPLKVSNEKYLIKTSMGMAVMYLPFFTAAHVFAKVFGYEADGFSEPYQFMIQFSGLIYLLIGLFYMRRILLLYFSEKVAAITLFCIVFGTNLFYYGSVHGAMSHAHTFCLASVLIWFIIKWIQKPDLKKSIVLGLCMGLIVLIRPVNILFVLFFVLYNVTSLKELQQRLLLFWNQKQLTVLMKVLAVLVFVPQLLYWKYITGQYFFNSYVGERFYFNHPHLIEGLFGFRKGWLLYSPIMIFSVIGMFMLFKARKEFSFPVTILFFIYTYIILSWWCWWYGGSYGMRAMIDIYPFLIFGFAVFVNKMVSNKIVLGILSLLVIVNCFQMFQYRRGVIHYDGMTKEAYMDALFRTETSPNLEKLIQRPDYEKARRGEE